MKHLLKPERCLNLLCALAGEDDAYPNAKLRVHVDGYNEDMMPIDTFQKRLERDKRDMRAMGISLRQGNIDLMCNYNYTAGNTSTGVILESIDLRGEPPRGRYQYVGVRLLWYFLKIIDLLPAPGEGRVDAIDLALDLGIPRGRLYQIANAMMMSGTPPYLPHDYFTYEFVGGEIGLIAGPNLKPFFRAMPKEVVSE